MDPKYISRLTVFDPVPLVPGLTYKRLNRLEEALDCFLKLHAILRNSAQVMYQLANLYPTNKFDMLHVSVCYTCANCFKQLYL